MDCFEHALGKGTARACASMTAREIKDMKFLKSTLLRFIEDPEKAFQGISCLYRQISLPSLQTEDDLLLHFEDLLISLFAAARGGKGDEVLKEQLLFRLECWEKEVQPWLKLS
jgi:hypothetical protein